MSAQTYGSILADLHQASRGQYAGPKIAVADIERALGSVEGLDPAAIGQHMSLAVGNTDVTGSGKGWLRPLLEILKHVAFGLIGDTVAEGVQGWWKNRGDSQQLDEEGKQATDALNDITCTSDTAAKEIISALAQSVAVLCQHLRCLNPSAGLEHQAAFQSTLSTASTLVDEAAGSITALCRDRDEAVAGCMERLVERTSQVCEAPQPATAPTVSTAPAAPTAPTTPAAPAGADTAATQSGASQQCEKEQRTPIPSSPPVTEPAAACVSPTPEKTLGPPVPAPAPAPVGEPASSCATAGTGSASVAPASAVTASTVPAGAVDLPVEPETKETGAAPRECAPPRDAQPAGDHLPPHDGASSRDGTPEREVSPASGAPSAEKTCAENEPQGAPEKPRGCAETADMTEIKTVMTQATTAGLDAVKWGMGIAQQAAEGALEAVGSFVEEAQESVEPNLEPCADEPCADAPRTEIAACDNPPAEKAVNEVVSSATPEGVCGQETLECPPAAREEPASMPPPMEECAVEEPAPAPAPELVDLASVPEPPPPAEKVAHMQAASNASVSGEVFDGAFAEPVVPVAEQESTEVEPEQQPSVSAESAEVNAAEKPSPIEEPTEIEGNAGPPGEPRSNGARKAGAW